MPTFKNPLFLIFIIIGAGLITLTLWYFIDFNVPEEESPQPKKIESSGKFQPPPPGSNDIDSKDQLPAEAVNMTVEGDEFSFSPSSLTVQKGSVVTLTFKNVGRLPHNFIVNELGIATKTIQAGQSDSVTFEVLENIGTITYSSYCSVPGHREAGMEGVISIE